MICKPGGKVDNSFFVFNTNSSYNNPPVAFNLKFHLDDVSASTRNTALNDTSPEIGQLVQNTAMEYCQQRIKSNKRASERFILPNSADRTFQGFQSNLRRHSSNAGCS